MTPITVASPTTLGLPLRASEQPARCRAIAGYFEAAGKHPLPTGPAPISGHPGIRATLDVPAASAAGR